VSPKPATIPGETGSRPLAEVLTGCLAAGPVRACARHPCPVARAICVGATRPRRPVVVAAEQLHLAGIEAPAPALPRETRRNRPLNDLAPPKRPILLMLTPGALPVEHRDGKIDNNFGTYREIC
jgi:hypothetical protein